MPAEFKIRPHRVFMRAELFEAMVDEIVQGVERLLTVHGPIKFVEYAGMIFEFFVNDFDHLFGDRIGWIDLRLRHILRARFAERFAILRIKIPLPAHRLFANDEHFMALAHLAVKEFHAQVFARARPLTKFLGGAEEMRVISPVNHVFGSF
jgi:hypothetical protein